MTRDRTTDSSETAPAVARRRRRGAAACWSGLACPLVAPDGSAPLVCWAGVVGGAGDRRVVAVLQPRALVRAPGRHRPDGRRGVRDVAPRPRVDRGAGCWLMFLCCPVPGPRARRVGGRQPPPLRRTRRAALVATILLACGALDARPDRWHQRRRRCAIPLAVDADSRGTPSRPGWPASLRQPPGSRPASRRFRRRRQPAKIPDKPARRSGRRTSPRRRGLFRQRRRSRVAGLSRTRPRRHRSRRADRDRLGEVAAGRAVAPADRTGLVVLRRRTATSSTRRSSAVTTRSSPATT